METDFYDAIIDIKSFIELQENREEGITKYNKFFNIIDILGYNDKGKNFILGKLTNKKEFKNKTIETKGISTLYSEIETHILFESVDYQKISNLLSKS